MKRTGRNHTAGILAGILLLLSLTAGAKAPQGSDRFVKPRRGGYAAGYADGYADGYSKGFQAAVRHATAAATPDSPAANESSATPERPVADSTATAPVSATARATRASTLENGVLTFAAGSTDAGRKFIHRIGAEFRPEYIFPTNPFLAGTNWARKPIETSLSAHLRYSLGFRPGSVPGHIYAAAYQGVGVARFAFGNREELGDPIAVYLFQGARIARLGPRLSLNYEWNFGLSFGWKPYDAVRNSRNVMMGSKMNAYLNVDFFLRWMLSRRIDLTAGFALTHFSNGNTKFPNAGLNAGGAKLGVTYNFGAPGGWMPPRLPRALRPEFPRHVSYDVVLFGSWRRKGVELNGRQLPSPEAYTVVGFNVAAMYNFGYKFRAGISADGVYDGSANVYTEDYIVSVGGKNPGYTFYKPGLDKQMSLGLSARTEFVMPYFTVGIGLGMNVLHKGGDLKAFYQVVTLKVALTRSSFLHIGYCLKDFQTPNYLMLGVGYRFNNKYPRIR